MSNKMFGMTHTGGDTGGRMDERIVAILQSRSIPFKYEDIRTALEEPSVRDWVDKHLKDDTLLSKEEIAL